MSSKTLVFLVVYFLSDFSYGQKNEKLFRRDYTYIESEKSFYKVHTTPKTFADAKRMCAHEGASLFYAENVDEANAVISFWNRTHPDIPWVSVGLSDIIAEGFFETVDGRPITEVYNRWQMSDPDNFGGNENCVHLNLQGNLNDYLCDSKAKFICKKSVQPRAPGSDCTKLNSEVDGQRNQESFRKDYNYIEAVESFYKFHTTPKNWRGAKRVCALEGASLFYPENSDEANAVISFWKLHQNSTQPSGTWVYVGISDIITEGEFETIDGKSNSEVYNIWNPNQPDNSGNEDCVHLNQLGYFNDITCSTQYNFICKKSFRSLEQNQNCHIQQAKLETQRNQESFRKDYSYIEAMESFYKFHTTPKNWRGAKRVCALEGASLFYPEKSDEANAVISFWKLHQNSTQPGGTWVYVGISDIITEGAFETIDGKSNSEVYNIWNPNQPDNSGNEDCVHLNQLGNFNDITCSTQYNFICKKSFRSLEQNQNCHIQQARLETQRNQESFRKDYSYIEAMESFYKFHTTPKNWRGAKRVCALEGASLFYPEKSDEANAVISFWKLHQNSTQPGGAWVYVGISDIITEGAFETIDGKSNSEVYNIWNPNQPDNSGNEDCVHLNQLGYFNDITCSTQYNFICKKRLRSLEQNQNCHIQQAKLGVEGQRNQKSFREDYSYIEAVESFYKFHTTPKNWRGAKRVCALEGASLFYPEKSDEVNAVISFWKLHQNNIQPGGVWVYVGISDIITEGEFETIDGKSNSEVYNIWNPNQPDNSGNEDCVHLNQLGNFNDITCSTQYNFICKKSFRSLEQNQNCHIQQAKLDGQNEMQNSFGRKDKNFFRKDYTYIEAEESFYKVHTTPQTFADAKRMCALEGASLFYAENVDEANAVISFWNRTQPNIPWVFVGLSDIKVEGLFETVDGRPITQVYRTWQLYQPDNSPAEQDCVHLNLYGKLNDNPCDRKSNFICKKSLKSLEWNNQCNMPNLDYTFNKDTGKCYKLHTAPLNWADAYAVCRTEYTSLAVISNQREADYLAKLTSSPPKPQFNEQYEREIYHLGFHNRFNEGWQTVRGTPMTAVANAWFANFKPDGNQYKKCGSFINGRLINSDCNMKRMFICERDEDCSNSHRIKKTENNNNLFAVKQIIY